MRRAARGSKRRAGFAALALAGCAGYARLAVAEDYAPPPAETFAYTTAPGDRTLRFVLEELGLLLAGTGYYFSEKDINSVDWEFGYTWDTLHAKLVGDAYAFDNNYFNTNFFSHPGAGALYYTAARSNRFSVWSSLTSGIAASTLWEVLGEFRERVSVNDMVITPVAGAVFGETLFQLGAFFDRGCDSTLNRVLGSSFGFAKSLHDQLDGMTLRRAARCDSHGFTLAGEHRFELGVGPTWVASDTRAKLNPALEANASARLANLPSLAHPGRGYTTFSDGNLAWLSIDTRADSRGLSRLRLRGLSVPLGVHFRDLRHVPFSGPVGREWLTGLGAGVDYSQQRFDPEGSAPDLFFVLEAPAWWLSWRRWFGAARLDLELLVASTLGGASAFARQRYLDQHPATDLTTVAENHGYNHVLGATLAPRIALYTRSWEWELTGRANRSVGVRVLDADGTRHSKVSTNERRREVSTRVVVGDVSGPRWQTRLEFVQRQGSIADVHENSAEFSFLSGLVLHY